MKRKTQELTLIFGSDDTGKSENIVEMIKNKKDEEKVYIVDYRGKYKGMLLNNRFEFSYHKLSEASYCNPFAFECDMSALKGEDYSNEFATHIEETVKVINYAPYSPYSDVVCRKVLLKMYRLAGITEDTYAPNAQADKILTRDMYIQILKEIDPDLTRLMEPVFQDLKQEGGSKELKNFFAPNQAFDTSKDIVVLDLDHYLAGDNMLTDLKLKSIILRLKKRMRTERKPVILVIDGVWPMGQRFLKHFTDATEKMKTYYLNNSFASFQMLNEEAFFLSDEMRIHRSDYKDIEAISKYFEEPTLMEHILSLPYKDCVSIRPGNDTARYGDYLFYRKDKPIEWIIDLGRRAA